MNDRSANTEDERDSRRKVVALAEDMLAGRLSYFEGADQIRAFQVRVGGVADHDPDFEAFAVIYSETDHLPMRAQHHLWSKTALERHGPEVAKVEGWAAPFASQACSNLLARFRQA